MKRLPALLLLGLSAAAPSVWADGSLMEVLSRALEHDAEYQRALADYDAGREAYPQARSIVLPTLSAQAAYTEIEREVRVTPFSDRPTQDDASAQFGPRAPFEDEFGSETWSVELRQPIFNWAIPATLSQGKDQVEVSRLIYRTEYKLLVHRVATEYVTYLAAADQLRFAQSEQKALTKDLETAQVRYDVGEASITGLRESQAAFDLAEARVIDAERRLRESREEMQRLSGHWYRDLPSLPEEVPLQVPEPQMADGWIDYANQYNSRILIAHRQKLIAEDEITRKQSAFIPRVDLVAAISDLDNSDFVFGNSSRDEAVGLEATWTPFAGGRSISELRESRALYRKSLAQEDFERRDVYILVRNSFNLVQSSIRRVNALDKAVESGRTALEATEAEFEVGERTQADVLTARRNVYRALTDRSAARYEYLAAVLNLKLYSGTLGEEDLAQLDLVLTGPELPEAPQTETPETDAAVVPATDAAPAAQTRQEG